MKKILLAIIICTTFSLSVFAQNSNMNTIMSPDTTKMKSKFILSVGIDEGIPVSTVSKFSSFVMGASVQGEYKVIRELGVTLSANYLYYLGKDGHDGLSMLPALGGVNFYITPKIFLAGQLGAAWYLGSNSGGKAYLTYAQGIGFRASTRISLLAKYEGINVGPDKTYSFAGLRISYNIFKK